MERFLDAPISVYMSSVTATMATQKRQRAVMDFLEARGISYARVDMSADLNARPRMLGMIPENFKSSGGPILPPQVFAGEEYCGGFELFDEAKEDDLVYTFFRLTPPKGSAEYRKAFPDEKKPPPPLEDGEEEEEEVDDSEASEESEEEVFHLHSSSKAYEPEVGMDGAGLEDTVMYQAALDSSKLVPDEVEEIEEAQSYTEGQENEGVEEVTDSESDNEMWELQVVDKTDD